MAYHRGKSPSVLVNFAIDEPPGRRLSLAARSASAPYPNWHDVDCGGRAGRVTLPGNLRRDEVPLVSLVSQVSPTIRHGRAAETACQVPA